MLVNSYGVELPFSCPISAALENRSAVSIQYMHLTDRITANNTDSCGSLTKMTCYGT